MENKKNNKKILLVVSIIIIILIISVITIILLNKKDLKTNKNVQVNAPQLIESMIPVKWKDNKWIETTTDDKDWYNYANKKWANVKLADGSMFVWIPRYAYKISKGYHENLTNGGEVDIKFLSGTTNNTFENEKIDISNTNSKDNYVISPAFKFGDENLEGIWVAKYEASREDSTSTETGKSQILSFKNNKLSVLDYDINQILYYCRNLEKQNNFGWKAQNGNILNTGDILEDDNNFDTHLIKNTEWGSVAYLSQSIYGINNKITANTSQISGNGGISSTTTGNETGIYDMSGQNAEYVSSYFESTTSNYTLEKIKNF